MASPFFTVLISTFFLSPLTSEVEHLHAVCRLLEFQLQFRDLSIGKDPRQTKILCQLTLEVQTDVIAYEIDVALAGVYGFKKQFNIINMP